MVHVCVNGTIVNTNHYSSPVPVVGLYIAAASFLCFLLIARDMWAGFRSKKFWFPCRFFSINSITLSILPIATKLPVDLTTAMPSVLDQLSKLSGTVFICMTMGFMLPSLAVNAEFESYANVIALTIFVVTVAVNICIQMATGVIFSFIAEHVIILACMFMLLLKFWTSVTTIQAAREDYTDKSNDHIRNGGNKMLERLQVCYLFSYHYCLQFVSCRTPFLADAALICMMCSLVLIQAMFRSLGMKDIIFCGKASDYRWSIWLVVVSQVLTVAAVSLAVGVRWLTNPLHFSDWLHNFLPNLEFDHPYLQFQYLFSSTNLPKVLEKCFRYVIYSPLSAITYVMIFSNAILQSFLGFGLLKCGILNIKDKKNEDLPEFEVLFGSRGIAEVETWVLRKSVGDMERWMKINTKASFPNLAALLSTIPPSEESSSTFDLNYPGINISTLSMVLLAETAKATITPTLQNKVSLANILAEAFDIIQFVDSKLYFGSSKDRLQYIAAQVIHKYSFATGAGELDLVENSDIEIDLGRFSFSPRSICWFDNELSGYANVAIGQLLAKIAGVIFQRSHESREVWYGRIEQLFVDMIHIFLSKLPVAIYTHIAESPAEEYQERVRLCLGFLYKIQSLEPYITFSLPPDSGITSLFATETRPTDMQVEGTKVKGQSTAKHTTFPEVGKFKTLFGFSLQNSVVGILYKVFTSSREGYN